MRTKGIHLKLSLNQYSRSTLHRHLSRQLINILIDTQSTLNQYLDRYRKWHLFVSWLTDLYVSINTHGMSVKISRLSTYCRPRCWLSLEEYWWRCQSRLIEILVAGWWRFWGSMEDIKCHSTANAFSTHDTKATVSKAVSSQRSFHTIVNHPVFFLAFPNNVRVLIFIHFLINIFQLTNLVRRI